MVYAPKKKPGYASWASIFSVPGKEKEYMLSFIEIRKGENTLYRPMPLDFYESLVLPIKYQTSLSNGSKDLVTEMVIMHSCDNGDSWREVGRGPGHEIVTNPFANICLKNGDLLRGVGTSYLCYYPEEIPELKIQKSSDRGNTWIDYSILLKDKRFFTTPYRLKQLKDGTLILLVTCWPSFGKDRMVKTRHSIPSNAILRNNALIYISKDGGRNWDTPISVLQGICASEPDFAELDSGDILIVNSTIQGGPPVRQYLYRTHNGIISGPVLRIISGEVPETFVATKDGLLVGANRRGIYSCSDNEGVTWYTISGDLICGYQPMITETDDGRFMCAWHYGGDNQYGEKNQFIGKHDFKVEFNIPQSTKINLERNMNHEKTQYVNSYTVTLVTGDKPLKGKRVMLAVSERWTPAYDNALDPRTAGKIFEMETDGEGKALLRLTEYDKIKNIHMTYRIIAYFIPDENDTKLSQCESAINEAYAVTSAIGKESSCRIYYNLEKIFVTGDVMEQFPCIDCFVDMFREKDSFDKNEVVKLLDIESTIADNILRFLEEQYIVKYDKDTGRFLWYYKILEPLSVAVIKDDFI